MSNSSKMRSVTCFKFRFTPHWFMLLLTIASTALLMKLGFWQLQRAEEKKHMLSLSQLQAKQPALSWNPKRPLPKQYQKVMLQGHFLKPVFLYDNQHYQHQFGYNVLSPLQLENGSVVLVDRGFVAGDSTRRQFPEMSRPKGLLQLQGSAYFPSSGNWVLGQESETIHAQLVVIERLDTKMMSDILQKPVYPFIMRLDQQDVPGFASNWSIISMPWQRHLGYAVQWFAMALVVLILFTVLNLKKKHDKKSV